MFICLDNSEIKGDSAQATLEYDYLVIGTGATNQTFGIKGVEEHACFLKEVWDAQKIRTKVMDCIETAAFPGQAEEEIERLLHMVVVGGGPTGIEYAAELHDFLKEDLASWYPGTYKCELIKKKKKTVIHNVFIGSSRLMYIVRFKNSLRRSRLLLLKLFPTSFLLSPSN